MTQQQSELLSLSFCSRTIQIPLFTDSHNELCKKPNSSSLISWSEVSSILHLDCILNVLCDAPENEPWLTIHQPNRTQR